MLTQELLTLIPQNLCCSEKVYSQHIVYIEKEKMVLKGLKRMKQSRVTTISVTLDKMLYVGKG